MSAKTAASKIGDEKLLEKRRESGCCLECGSPVTEAKLAIRPRTTAGGHAGFAHRIERRKHAC